MEEQEPEDTIQRKISQYYRDILKLQKMQNVGLQSTIKSLREELDNTKSKARSHSLDAKLPLMTQRQILEILRKESTIERSVKELSSRMEAVERNLGLILQNQITQAELLNQLLSTHYGSSSLPVDNYKKGEKE